MATIAAAVIGAAGAIGGGVLASQGSKAAAQAAGRGKPTRIPLPKYADALNRYTARLLAANATNVAPSFGDWLGSGGTATFPMHDTGFTPAEAAHLHLVDPRTGKAIPFVDPSQTNLSPEQLLYLGQQRLRLSKGAAQDPIANYARVTARLGHLGEREQTPGVQRRETRLEGRKTRIEGKLGIGEEG